MRTLCLQATHVSSKALGEPLYDANESIRGGDFPSQQRLEAVAEQDGSWREDAAPQIK
ncbi:hypothetical protein [Streptomyces sp. NPDC047061]|uniref:hypothetical protein n=1 Tax=Streptomyces sp. NPDC047061 TaxID=3154605 RepID=UPI0033C28242